MSKLLKLSIEQVLVVKGSNFAKLEFFLNWFYMLSVYYFIFQILIWKINSVYLLWFDYLTLKECKTTKVQSHSVSAY